jgi:hypothetical protein
MFLCLRHDAFIGCDDQQSGVDAPDTGQHVFDKVTVTGHIYNTDLLAVWQCKPAEAEFDGHLALLLFFQAVGMSACERSDECGFAVVNMTGGADNAHGLFWGLTNVPHDAFVGGEPLMEHVHKFL